MRKYLFWIVGVFFSVHLSAQVNGAGFYLTGGYSKPFCKNVYITPEGESGGTIGIGLFNQINEHWELTGLLGKTLIDFNDVEYYYYDKKNPAASSFYKGKISLNATTVEIQTRYFILDHKLGIGAGLFAGWYTGNSGVDNNFSAATVTNGYLVSNGVLNSGSNSLNVHFADRGLGGTIMGLYYQPFTRVQLYCRYDINFIDIWYEARDVIDRTKYDMFKAGIEFRLIRSYHKRRY
jgi:hypothetical protein